MPIANDKRYDPELAKKYDGPSKQAFVEWADQRKMHDLKINEAESRGDFTKGIYDIEVTTPQNIRCRFDVETKKDWGIKWPLFPFDTFDVPYRKRKANATTHHMLFGGLYNLAAIIKREHVVASDVKDKRCENRGGEWEPFYKVPLKFVHLWEKVDGLWQPAGDELLAPHLRR